MAIEIKAIPTLEGKDAERFIERADEAEMKQNASSRALVV